MNRGIEEWVNGLIGGRTIEWVNRVNEEMDQRVNKRMNEVDIWKEAAKWVEIVFISTVKSERRTRNILIVGKF